MLGIGIDFGTSNSSAATFDGETLRMIPIDAAARTPDVMPTALYLDRKLAATVGQGAIDTYLRANANRRITLERENIGQLAMHVASTDQSKDPSGADGIAVQMQVHAYTDRGLPGRLFRGVKRWLGTASLDHVRVFDRRFRLVALVTPVLSHLVEASRAHPTARTYIGRPVHYEGSGPDSDAVALHRMDEACGHAGLRERTLHPEPIAAALSYLHRVPDAQDQVLLAFDFGGGTLDCALLRCRASGSGDAAARSEVLATHGIGLGGDEINRMIYRAKVFPELGEGLTHRIPVVDELRSVSFPFDRFADRLLNWSLAYELNRPELRELMAQAMRESADARRRLTRLFELVTRNQAYQVFQAIERAKVELSSHDTARIELDEIDLDVELSRAELERILAPAFERIERCVDAVLRAAGIGADQVDHVVSTGGSSFIPAVVRLLEARFPRRVVAHDPFTSIAAGLAIASYHGRKSE